MGDGNGGAVLLVGKAFVVATGILSLSVLLLLSSSDALKGLIVFALPVIIPVLILLLISSFFEASKSSFPLQLKNDSRHQVERGS